MYFLELIGPNLQNILNVVLGGGTITGIIVWVRYLKRDKATAGKTDAEAEKVRADAYAVKAAADITIVDSAFKLIQKLTEDNEMAKKALEKAQVDLEEAKEKLMQVNSQLRDLQHDLNNERQTNITRSLEIEELKEELRKLRETYE